MRTKIAIALAGSAVVAAGSAGSATALPPFGTGPITRPAAAGTGQTELVATTVGRHAAFDRMVFRFRGGTPGVRVRYVSRVVQDGSGVPVPLRGRRFLQIVFDPARAHPQNGAGSNVPAVLTPLFPTLRQLKVAGDFEGVVTYGAGLAKRAGFRVFVLSNPRRVVLDVAH